MKSKMLIHYKYRKIGWIILIPSMLLGFLALSFDWEPDFLNAWVFSILSESFTSSGHVFKNNLLNEILGIGVIVGGLLVALSKEKSEDELIAKIRLDALLWAILINYVVLLFAFIFIYDLGFFWAMIFNMFTPLFIFIGRYHYMVWKLKHLEK